MPKKITIMFDTELDPELYSDIANTLWMQVSAMSDRGKRYGFQLMPDGDGELNKRMNADWDEIGEKWRWGGGR
ncbi:hypothetical protein [Nocardia sp. CA-290969]|uniref:hypothetical protein n=1 Tax=Nocardia sp. CA-290969 TaxID=3239986 RepID=UPI003D8A0359